MWVPSHPLPDCGTMLDAAQRHRGVHAAHRPCRVTHGALPCAQVVGEPLGMPRRRSVGWGRLDRSLQGALTQDDPLRQRLVLQGAHPWCPGGVREGVTAPRLRDRSAPPLALGWSRVARWRVRAWIPAVVSRGGSRSAAVRVDRAPHARSARPVAWGLRTTGCGRRGTGRTPCKGT
jgi:hypothetical protein